MAWVSAAALLDATGTASSEPATATRGNAWSTRLAAERCAAPRIDASALRGRDAGPFDTPITAGPVAAAVTDAGIALRRWRSRIRVQAHAAGRAT